MSATEADITIARELIRLGVPVFVAERAADFPHGGTGDTGYYFPTGWQDAKPDESVLDTYQDRDALCAVMGSVYDVLDIDPRNGGDDSHEALCDELAGETPLSYGSVTTPSGGWHEWIAALGIGKHTDFWKSAGWNGLDLQGGLRMAAASASCSSRPLSGGRRLTGRSTPTSGTSHPRSRNRMTSQAPRCRS